MKEETVRLVKRAQNGHDSSFADLVRLYTDRVMAICYKIVEEKSAAEDMSQEIFLKVYEKLDDLEDPEKFPAWLSRIAKNHCIDYLRTNRNHPSVEQLQESGFEPGIRRETELPPGEVVESEELYGIVVNTIEEMKDIYRDPLMLKYLHGKSYRQISDVLGIAEDTVRTRLYRGREILRDQLQDRVPEFHSVLEKL